MRPLATGETLGVLGESGSGKTTLAAALLRTVPTNGRVLEGAIRFEGRDLLKIKFRELQRIRGNRIAMVFQESPLALHPTIRVRNQIIDVIASHQELPRAVILEKTQQILAALFPNEAEQIADSYPHQLSGGQQSRVLIAQAICCGPSLIVADEPTVSLDPNTEQEILSIFRTLRKEFMLSFLWITLYAGRVLECGPTHTLLSLPSHPYTIALLRCRTPLFGDTLIHKSKLPVIPGDSPVPSARLNGCQFEPRCTERLPACKLREPPATALSDVHEVSCFKYGG
jgi:peptide/nickel transport system ATP-binding protein